MRGSSETRATFPESLRGLSSTEAGSDALLVTVVSGSESLVDIVICEFESWAVTVNWEPGVSTFLKRKMSSFFLC